MNMEYKFRDYLETECLTIAKRIGIYEKNNMYEWAQLFNVMYLYISTYVSPEKSKEYIFLLERGTSFQPYKILQSAEFGKMIKEYFSHISDESYAVEDLYNQINNMVMEKPSNSLEKRMGSMMAYRRRYLEDMPTKPSAVIFFLDSCTEGFMNFLYSDMPVTQQQIHSFMEQLNIEKICTDFKEGIAWPRPVLDMVEIVQDAIDEYHTLSDRCILRNSTDKSTFGNLKELGLLRKGDTE